MKSPSKLSQLLIERCYLFIEQGLKNAALLDKTNIFTLIDNLLLQDELSTFQAEKLRDLIMLNINSQSGEIDLSLKALRVWQRTGRAMPDSLQNDKKTLDLLYSENSHIRSGMATLLNASWGFNFDALELVSDEAVLLTAVNKERGKMPQLISNSIPLQTYR